MAVRIYAGESWGSRNRCSRFGRTSFPSVHQGSHVSNPIFPRRRLRGTFLINKSPVLEVDHSIVFIPHESVYPMTCLSLRPWMALHSIKPFPELHWICNEGLEIRGTPYQKSGENGWPDEWCGMTNKREQATKFWNPICRPHTMVLYKDVQCLLSQGVKFCFFSMHEII